MSEAPTREAGLSGVRWRLVLLSGVGVQVLTLAAITVIISLYAGILAATTGRSPDPSRLETFAILVGTWGSVALPILLTAVAAAWVARKAGALAVRHGFLVGVVSALCGFAIGVAFRGTPAALATMFALALLAGCLGGLEARRVLPSRGAFYRASRSIGVARSPQDIVEAVGEHLADSRVERVALWQTALDHGPAEFSLQAVWKAPKSRPWRQDPRLLTAPAPVVAKLADETPFVLRPERLPRAERSVWEELGVRRALLLPLASPDGALSGVLMVTSTAPRTFSRGLQRAYLNISAQVALALENQRLVEEGRKTGVMAERGRLAREIHDTLAQGFISIVTHLEAAEDALSPDGEPGDTPVGRRHLDQARRTARENLVEARRLVAALRPEILESSSLPEALDRLAQRWSEEADVPAGFSVTGSVRPLLQELQVTVFRVAQEALSNVRRHANANRVDLTLSYLDDLVLLDVQDDGVGFDPALCSNGVGGGFGLHTMRERVERLGGSLAVESAPDEGTTLVAELPMRVPVGETS